MVSLIIPIYNYASRVHRTIDEVNDFCTESDKDWEVIFVDDGSVDQTVAAVKALDRVLTAGRYVVPFGYDNISRLAHDSSLKFPNRLPMYGDWTGFLPDVWWVE